MYETACEYTSEDERMLISTSERKVITKLRKLKQKCPAEIEITREPEQNDGYLCAKVPINWLHINPPRKIELTDERREELAERLRAVRKNVG